MAFERRIDGSDAVRNGDPVTSVDRRQELRRDRRTTHLATGTLACPECDAPVMPAGAVAPQDALTCPVCAHAGAVRDFLSLATPTRPARVDVRLVPHRRTTPAS